IVSKVLFEQVQAVFEGKNIKKTERHFFVFRRQVFCAKCRNRYIAETQKGNVYYRCHTRSCTRGTLREELLEKKVIETTKKLQMDKFEYEYFKQETLKESQKSEANYEAEYKRLQLFENNVKDRLSKLADAYVDGVFDKETYINKKNELLMEEQSIKEKLANFRRNSDEAVKRMEAFLELVNSAYLSYKWGEPEEKQELVKTIFSNCEVNEKNILVKPYLPFQLMLERTRFTAGSPYREAARTLSSLFKKLYKYFSNTDTSKSDNQFLNYLTSKTGENTKT
ncbi:MAG TPA: zinc ribbon domain-containing protein, partial [Pyrinomonadaceae bacterium]|nr:zinc ribbon domain-containing protein [Pyrinomonadaceae bacterium]